ncbi:RidA family protein [Dichelobacter nodosus]|uniref:Endoribonuclease L-PSP family protein n=1 Tax=Dichelobacter nodosus (strain VCS1703A) TaxID=246195 RepID=A5EX28_DICNV|nr:RidA family protein [Dichelobacter nodosus]ABQ13552.1 endoribonuclease L-PSP family protein [Dichelobacter nodosus VCS1703A]
MIEYIDPEARYSEAAIHNGLVYLSGQVPEDAKADITGQTQSVLKQIDALLKRCGSDKAHILEATVFIADMADFAAMNEVWEAWTEKNCAPPRACVQAQLAFPDWKLEVKLIAAQIQSA